MNTEGKVWGVTQSLFNKNNVEIHRIQANKGGYCSKHKHLHKYNMFYVEEGTLVVETWKNDYDLVDITVLNKGQYTTVKPGEFHRFTASSDVVAYEIYWTEISVNDIVRETCGGLGDA